METLSTCAPTITPSLTTHYSNFRPANSDIPPMGCSVLWSCQRNPGLCDTHTNLHVGLVAEHPNSVSWLVQQFAHSISPFLYVYILSFTPKCRASCTCALVTITALRYCIAKLLLSYFLGRGVLVCPLANIDAMQKKHGHLSVLAHDLHPCAQDNNIRQLSLQHATYDTVIAYYNSTFQWQGCGFPADSHTFDDED